MPFHAPYEAMIEPGIADLDNAPSGGAFDAFGAFHTSFGLNVCSYCGFGYHDRLVLFWKLFVVT